MAKRMIIMFISLGILFGGIAAYKIFGMFMMKKYMAANANPTINVSAMKVEYQPWQPQLKATGSLRAIKGVNVTTEIAGMVQTIYFAPGTPVTEGTVLVQLNADTDIAQLKSLQANAALAKITYERDKAQYALKAVSKATLDTDEANLKSLEAQVAEQTALVNKKTIRAPFTGQLGISLVNPGQFLNPGNAVVNLQTLDPIYVDFFVPQQSLMQLKLGQTVTVTSDSFPNNIFTGAITTVNPAVDPNTRNVEVEATIPNPEYKLTPGMFTAVEVNIGEPQKFLTIPQAAVSFNPYGEIVYIIKKSNTEQNENPVLIAKQTFIKTGETRGDQIAVLEGLKGGDMIVTSGQLKLKNGSHISIDNSLAPANNPDFSVEDEG